MLGEREYEISVEVSDAALRRYGLDFDQVVTAVRARSRDLPGGRVRTAQGSVTLRSVSQAYTGEEFAALVLLSRDDGTRLLLGDVASVSDGFVDQPVLSTLNGKRALTLVVDRVGDQNVLHITQQVHDYIERKRASLAPGIHLDGWYDQSEILRGRISLMLRNAAQGAFLVVLTLGLFLDVGLALWVIMGVPFAILATLATIQIFGLPISINVLSVFAFILVLGILVDDGIVTAESAYARLEAELQDLALGLAPFGLELRLDGVEVGQRLAHGRTGHEPTEALPGVDQAFSPQFIQRLADRHPGGAVRSGQLGFRRQHAARGELALGEASPQVGSDIAISDGAHLSHSCML